MAVNILPESHPLRVWKDFWQWAGGGDQVLLAEDIGQRAVAALAVTGLGTTIIVDRNGRVVYRDSGPTAYERLRSEVDRAL